MEDFNQAMKNIENGLCRAEENLDGLVPLAATYYHESVSGRAPASPWGEIYFNTFTKEKNAFDREGFSWKDSVLSLGEQKSWHLNTDVNYIIQYGGFGFYPPTEYYGSSVYLHFTAPGAGILRTFRSGMTAAEGQEKELTAQFRAVCKRWNGENLVTVLECEPFPVHFTGSETKQVDVRLELPMVGGGQYYIFLEWVSGEGGGPDFRGSSRQGSENYYHNGLVCTHGGVLRETIIPPECCRSYCLKSKKCWHMG